MRILICHERFLFRYGADRVFIIIGQRLKALGHHVTMLAARYDREVLEEFADEIVTLPTPTDYARLDEFCSRWLELAFLPRARKAGGFDLIIHGGWPLFSATEVMGQLAPVVLFLDHGVVPDAGYTPFQQGVLRWVRQLRRTHLCHCTHAVGVSRFVVETQTIPDAGPGVPVRVILNGTDHLVPPPPPAEESPEPGAGFAMVRELAGAGHPLLLNLGRFEAGTYKNSQAVLRLFELVQSACPEARLLVLEKESQLNLPGHLRGSVIPLGFPDDDGLSRIIDLVDVGVSLSRWEGFNLPLVELLRRGRPALAYRIGAHPEVVPDAWFLCDNLPELAAKATLILRDPTAAAGRLSSPAASAHWQYLGWDRFVDELLAFAQIAPASPAGLVSLP